jgi:hypothetical protein
LPLAQAQEEARGQYALVHCASGNRVGALFALKAHFVDGLSVPYSLAFGRTAGLDSLDVEVGRIITGR